MPLLPTITFGGQEFYDISGIVRSDASMGGTRPTTDGFAIHHSVGQTEFPDTNMNGTSLDEQIAHIKAIDNYHVQQGYGGFGYNAIGFRDGTVFTVGNCSGKRAHVAFENWHLGGFCMAGTFTDKDVPIGLQLGGGRWLYAMEKVYGPHPAKGHQDWVNLAAHPTWATACPGAKGKAFIGKMVLVKAALLANEGAALEAEVKRKMAEVLVPSAQAANLELLAAQVRFLSKGQFC